MLMFFFSGWHHNICTKEMNIWIWTFIFFVFRAHKRITRQSFLPSFQALMQGYTNWEKDAFLVFLVLLHPVWLSKSSHATEGVDTFVMWSRRPCDVWKSQPISTPDTARYKRISIQLSWQCTSGLIIHNARLMGGNYPTLPVLLLSHREHQFGYCNRETAVSLQGIAGSGAHLI